ncbi:hypothetical protein M0811_12189 [Anaeramoeba ignava]|uniref:Uncharacterized protein n=1 Tax=Anaeramoeba ignava TaxID=1746090 RepID=A0A9Q0L9N4_ANAIG|nr:hypothetical protein M0811_12189 [Anaeramoeba ignava]
MDKKIQLKNIKNKKRKSIEETKENLPIQSILKNPKKGKKKEEKQKEEELELELNFEKEEDYYLWANQLFEELISQNEEFEKKIEEFIHLFSSQMETFWKLFIQKMKNIKNNIKNNSKLFSKEIKQIHQENQQLFVEISSIKHHSKQLDKSLSN